MDAVAMRFALMGEAARRTNGSAGKALTDVPFDQIRGLRNRIAHEYDDLDQAMLYETAQREIPALVASREVFLRSR